MTLIKSISGIRGTIGGPATENLTPLDIVKFTTAYVRFIAESAPGKRLKIVVGRDGCGFGDETHVGGGDFNDIEGGEALRRRAAAPVFRVKWSATSSKARCWAAART